MTDVDPLVRPLAALVSELACRLDDSDEESVNERWAVNALEWIAYVCGQLPSEQRQRMAQVMAGLAAEARPGPEREFLESYAEDFGLLDEDDEQGHGHPREAYGDVSGAGGFGLGVCQPSPKVTT